MFYDGENEWACKEYYETAIKILDSQINVYHTRFGTQMPVPLACQLWQKQIDHYCHEEDLD